MKDDKKQKTFRIFSGFQIFEGEKDNWEGRKREQWEGTMHKKKKFKPESVNW